ncbi:hypothetical protein [Krasilnikovia sp. MM14-A1259]|uniref:hypothetical protein n=1 Tax=Krasilnikovia sp. MM14-A1259 TaxID=3373539 RepID=UPI0037F91CDF
MARQAEIDDLDVHLTALVTAAPDLVALPGVGVGTAGQLIVTARDNPIACAMRRRSPASAEQHRSRSVPDAPTGTDRHRGGDRDPNSAL